MTTSGSTSGSTTGTSVTCTPGSFGTEGFDNITTLLSTGWTIAGMI